MKRIDVGLVMLFTYTAVVPDAEAKLLLLPLLSGFQTITTAWLKPYANSQNQILDFVDVYLGTVRFILFSCIAALLILQPGEGPTHAPGHLFAVHAPGHDHLSGPPHSRAIPPARSRR